MKIKMGNKPQLTVAINNLLFLLFLTRIISGCSTVSYVEPKSGPIARVRFVTDTDGIAAVREYASTNCDNEKEMMRLRNGYLLNSNPKCLGIPLWNYHKNAAKEFFISANIPHVYMVYGSEITGSTIYRCAVILSQEFEEGKDYEIYYKWNASKCSVDISEIKKNDLGIAEKILLQKRTNKLNNDFSLSCMKVFKNPRLF